MKDTTWTKLNDEYKGTPRMGVAIRFMTVRRIMPFDWLWQVQDLSGSTRGQGFSYFKKSAMKAAINFVDNEKV